MKRILWTTFSFILIIIFVAFLHYLLQPMWPSLSNILYKIAENIKSFLKVDINSRIISLIIFIIFFFIVYSSVTIIANSIRKKTKLVLDEIDPNVRYKSVPFTIVKLILIIIFFPLIYGYGKALIFFLRDISFDNKRLIFFSLGFAFFSIIWLIFWKKWGFFSIFEHEFTHLISALCFFHKPKAFHVDEYEGGWVKLAGVNFIITLNPYFFLTLCFMMLPFYLIIRQEFYIYYFLFMGMFTSYHTLSTIRETNFSRQPDIIFNGKIFSFFVIILGNIFCYGFILSFVLGGFSKGREFISMGWNEAISLVRLVISRF